jgi:hypothetical protein
MLDEIIWMGIGEAHPIFRPSAGYGQSAVATAMAAMKK